jgi:hypothetical protein
MPPRKSKLTHQMTVEEMRQKEWEKDFGQMSICEQKWE